MPNFSLAYGRAQTQKCTPTLAIYLSVCLSAEEWKQPSPEFINLHLKDISGTSRRPYALWLLDWFPLLGLSSRRWTVWRAAQMARWCFPYFFSATCAASMPRVRILNLCYSLKMSHRYSSAVHLDGARSNEVTLEIQSYCLGLFLAGYVM